MNKLITLLANARKDYLMKSNGLNNEQAEKLVTDEIAEYSKNNPNTSYTSGSASEMIPTAVMFDKVVETAPNGRWSFLKGLSAGIQPLRSENNEYPILGDINYANGATEWGSGSFYDGKTGTESLNSGTITITPKQIYASYGISKQLKQYSMVDLIPIALKRLSESMLYSVAVSVINGDSSTGTSNINCFGTAPATYFASNGGLLNANVLHDNGLRDLTYNGTLGVTKISVGTPAGADDIFDGMKLISFGGSPEDYMMIMDNRTYFTYMKHQDFKDASINGKASTITTGAVTSIAGVELFVTDVVPLTDSTGVVSATTPANNIKGSIIICKKNCIQHGFFGEVEFDVKYDIQKGVLVEATADFGFANISQRAGRNESVLLYNIDVA